jgi:hypothetical protein
MNYNNFDISKHILTPGIIFIIYQHSTYLLYLYLSSTPFTILIYSSTYIIIFFIFKRLTIDNRLHEPQ